MSNELKILDARTAGKSAYGGFHPKDRGIRVNTHTGQFVRGNGMVVNSLLTEDEWVEVDQAIIGPSLAPLRVVQDLRSLGLTKRLGGVGSLESRWYSESEITDATVNMTGRGRAERDLPDLSQSAVPVPVILKEFAIDFRTLDASRKLGDGLDMTGLVAATRVVAEAHEDLVVNGNTSVRLNGSPIYGLATHPNRLTDTASNYGGGDWGTIANIVPTIAGAVDAANEQHNYGPFIVYVSQTQYNQAALTHYGDGTAQTAMDRVKALDMIQDVRALPASTLPAGEILMIQPNMEYFALSEAQGIQVREWTSGDGLESIFKVMYIGTIEVKARYGNETGIVHITGA